MFRNSTLPAWQIFGLRYFVSNSMNLGFTSFSVKASHLQKFAPRSGNPNF
jgi:hypothetical protein